MSEHWSNDAARDRLADGRLDLAFDSNNAQGIFQMTDARQVQSTGDPS